MLVRNPRYWGFFIRIIWTFVHPQTRTRFAKASLIDSGNALNYPTRICAYTEHRDRGSERAQLA
jgi:hypothetical protein